MISRTKENEGVEVRRITTLRKYYLKTHKKNQIAMKKPRAHTKTLWKNMRIMVKDGEKMKIYYEKQKEKRIRSNMQI